MRAAPTPVTPKDYQQFLSGNLRSVMTDAPRYLALKPGIPASTLVNLIRHLCHTDLVSFGAPDHNNLVNVSHDSENLVVIKVDAGPRATSFALEFDLATSEVTSRLASPRDKSSDA